ncbi:hypothetical protein Scep_003304 [Stephania cephalantha]|uniref:Secreted protein n=1 Tax=Stephania cephalantha TaxID=152367 RepID=A0AAP0PVP1_9MAGN
MVGLLFTCSVLLSEIQCALSLSLSTVCSKAKRKLAIRISGENEKINEFSKMPLHLFLNTKLIPLFFFFYSLYL